MLEKQPIEIVVCKLECIVMPNGEIICLGKTIGQYKELKDCLELAPTFKEVTD